MIDPVLFYIASFALAALALLLVAVIALYLKISKKYIDLKAKVEGEKSEFVKERNSLIADGQQKAMQVLDGARVQAQKIISSSNAFNQGQENAIKQELEKAMQLYKAEYAKALEEIKQNTNQTVSQISSEIQASSKNSFSNLDKEMLTQINSFKEDIASYLASFQESLKGLTEEEKKRVQEDFEKMKEEKIANLNEKIIKAVEMVSQEFFEKGLSAKEHEDLIFSALTQAKKDKFFD